MIKITLNGKPFNRENLESSVMESLAAQIREKLGSIRHPETGEFPTIAVTGSSLADMKIELEGSAALVALAKQRLQNSASDDNMLESAADSSTPALVQPSGPKVFELCVRR